MANLFSMSLRSVANQSTSKSLRTSAFGNLIHPQASSSRSIESLLFRSAFSTRSLSTTPLVSIDARSKSKRPSWSQTNQTRSVSTGKPSHNALAQMEASANNNPSSASLQNVFYSALMRAGLPEILVERFETGRYATNSACDTLYQRALESTGQSGGAAMQSLGQQGLSAEQRNAIAQAIGANSRGASYANIRPNSNDTGGRNSPMHVVVDESRGMKMFKILRFFTIFGAVAYASMVLLNLAIESTGVFKKIGGTQNAEVKPEEQKARFKDVQGCDEAKDELQEVVDFLRSPDKYNQLGGKLPKGVLMVGPPGTGKTLLARAVAGEAGVPFFYMSGSEFDEVYVGVGAKRVRELFANAKAKAPAIVFIDELDAMGGKRNERDASYHMQTLNQMLTELDGFDQTTGVVFIAATNFPQMLDKALTRPGRFDRTIHVPLPDVRGRVNILKHYLQAMKIATEVDATLIARGTPGFSGADLENLVNQAAVHASKVGATAVGMLDLEWAKDRVLMGAEKRSMVIQEKDKLMTAYHEAGHAIVALFSQAADPLYKVTIMPRGNALGITYSIPDMDQVSMTKAQMNAHIDKAMGGKIAEEIVYGSDQVTSGCSSDLASATDVAYGMVTQYGMSDKLGSIAWNNDKYHLLSTKTKETIEQEIRRFLDEGEIRAREILTEKRKELDLLAQGLMKYETLNKEEVEKVIRGESLPDRMQTLPGVGLKIPEIKLPLLGGSGSSGEGDGGTPVVPETAGS